MQTRTCLFCKWEGSPAQKFVLNPTHQRELKYKYLNYHHYYRSRGAPCAQASGIQDAGRCRHIWRATVCAARRENSCHLVELDVLFAFCPTRGVRGVARAIPVRSTRVIVGCAQSSMSTCEPVSLLLPSSVLSSSRCLHGVAQPGLRQCHSHP